MEIGSLKSFHENEVAGENATDQMFKNLNME